MKPTPIVMLGVLVAVGVAVRGGTAHQVQRASGARGVSGRVGTATLESVHQHGTSSRLLLQGSDGTLFDLNVASSISIATRNTGQVPTEDLRSGDRLVVRRDGTLQDISQLTVTLAGVVASAPLARTGVMTVQIAPTRAILVDLDPTTQYSDTSGMTSSTVVLNDADTVIVHGVLDSTMDEVVSTGGIERTGPKPTRSYSST